MQMRTKFALLCISCFLFAVGILSQTKSPARSIRTVEVDDGNVTTVNTAVGYSTILEFQSKPISAVLGDQDSFKVEYVGNSLTIKPLVPHAKSNLFIFTEYERFNCQLVTGSPKLVDYILRVRVKTKAYPVQTGGAEPSIHVAIPRLITRAVRRASFYGGFALSVLSLSRDRKATGPRSATIIDFELSSRKTPYQFQARSIGVKQLGRFVSLESVYLDSLQLVPGGPAVHGRIALLSQDFKPQQPVTVVFAVPCLNPAQGSHRLEVSTASEPKHGQEIESAKKSRKTDEKGK